MAVADPIARLVKELAKLPGIGEKTAQRLALHILEAGPQYSGDLASAVGMLTHYSSPVPSCPN